MSQSVEIKLFTGKKLTIHELTGIEQTGVNEMIGLDKGLSVMEYRAVATIDSIDGDPITPVSSIIDLKARIGMFSRGSELEHLSRIVRKRFGMPDDVDELGNA